VTDPVTILTFHHVHPGKDRLTVPPDIFAKALEQVQARHTFAAYDQFKQLLISDRSFPRGQVLLTFDDGYLDNYLYAYPVLKRMNVPAVMFPITGLVRESGRCRQSITPIGHKTLLAAPDADYFLNTAEIETMHRSGLVAFASHSTSHVYFNGLSLDTMRNEFDTSLAFIRKLGAETAPYGFCWPGGKFDDAALAAIRQSDYRLAFSTVDGGWRRGDDPFTIRRIDVSSFSGDPKDYLLRIRRKLFIYGTPVLGHWYSRFKALRTSAGRAVKAPFKR
jgi:peptidoglycan/xylan/chitin deacetylase (PgdA/CDA1 family)